MGKKLKYLPIGMQLWVKNRALYSYHQPLHGILKELYTAIRTLSVVKTSGYLKELGYE
jgi:hypothetical protein